MGRYRTYKNGITGHRYKGYYIIKGEKGKFQIWNEDKSIYKKDILDYDECEWIIDKDTAGKEDQVMIAQLYDMEIFQLSALMLDIIQNKDNDVVEAKSEKLYEWVVKIRGRKVKNRGL